MFEAGISIVDAASSAYTSLSPDVHDERRPGDPVPDDGAVVVVEAGDELYLQARRLQRHGCGGAHACGGRWRQHRGQPVAGGQGRPAGCGSPGRGAARGHARQGAQHGTEAKLQPKGRG